MVAETSTTCKVTVPKVKLETASLWGAPLDELMPAEIRGAVLAEMSLLRLNRHHTGTVSISSRMRWMGAPVLVGSVRTGANTMITNEPLPNQ